MRSSLLCLLILSLVGCKDDPTALGGDVVGTWRELPNATDDDPPEIAERQLLEFTSSGTVIETENDVSEMSTYDAGDGMLTMTADDGASVALPYLATSNRLVIGALVPDGDQDGFVGTWTGNSSAAGESIDLTIKLDASMTAQVDYDRSVSEDDSYTGTWRAIGDDLEVTFMVEVFTVHMRATRVGDALGTAYERL
ncbi:MAG: hypothetical protein WKG01_22190 [Kofleriaceae bacterium]